MLRRIFFAWACVLLAVPALAQTDRAAVMVVDAEPVEMQRAGTEQWLPVTVEAIVGVGDQIRTGENGQATITFLGTGAETTLEPNTTYQIDEFTGSDEQFSISVSVIVGQTRQRLERALDAGSSYDVTTPGATLSARGTVFRVRVEPAGRAAMLVSEGVVAAAAEDEREDVPASFGVRSQDDGTTLSDIVRADTFAELDSALDGCAVSITTPDDVRLNVRLGPGTEFERVGTIAAEDIAIVKGTVEGSAWYRIDFRGGFGWVLASSAAIEGQCAGLRQFDADHGPEDPTAYDFLGNPLSLEDLNVTEEPAAATEEAASE
jgi:hypothetical protein